MMNSFKLQTCLLLVTLSYAMLLSAASIIRENHDRRSTSKELSDADHDLNGHNAEYDHEAFLGKERAHQFDTYSPEESKERLGVLVDKIDSDNDHSVTESEMVAWIKYIQRRYVNDDGKRQWTSYGMKDGQSMSWDYYQNRTYGSMTNDEYEADDDVLSYKDMRERDFRRFKLADTDYDDILDFSEYVNFLHPEDAPHMREVVVKETLDDLDKDKDGTVSIDEYIGDMWPQIGNEDEPDWVQTEREHFDKWRDLNQDGVLDEKEIQHWVMPDDYDHAIAESKHLIHEADADKDGSLSKSEVIDHYDLFVGSQVTDFGEALGQTHDEF